MSGGLRRSRIAASWYWSRAAFVRSPDPVKRDSSTPGEVVLPNARAGRLRDEVQRGSATLRGVADIRTQHRQVAPDPREVAVPQAHDAHGVTLSGLSSGHVEVDTGWRLEDHPGLLGVDALA